MAVTPGITCTRHQKRVELADHRPSQGLHFVHEYNGAHCDSQTFLNTEEITYGYAYGLLITAGVVARHQEAPR